MSPQFSPPHLNPVSAASNPPLEPNFQVSVTNSMEDDCNRDGAYFPLSAPPEEIMTPDLKSNLATPIEPSARGASGLNEITAEAATTSDSNVSNKSTNRWGIPPPLSPRSRRKWRHRHQEELAAEESRRKLEAAKKKESGTLNPRGWRKYAPMLCCVGVFGLQLGLYADPATNPKVCCCMDAQSDVLNHCVQCCSHETGCSFCCEACFAPCCDNYCCDDFCCLCCDCCNDGYGTMFCMCDHVCDNCCDFGICCL